MTSRRRQNGHRRSNLARAVIGAVGALAVVGISTLYLTGEPWSHQGHWGWQGQTWEKRVTYAGALVTALGAVIALVVSYRKQQDLEDGRYATQFAAGAAQLGDASAAVRIAGAYALAALADGHRDRRQQCIDALCAYMRLAYDPEFGGGHAASRTVESVNAAGTKSITTHTYRIADREVRLTIISILRDHLRDPKSRTSWCGYDLNFSGAVFDGGSFVGAHFTGGSVQFNGAKFVADRLSFFDAVFSGATVSFHGASFLGGLVSFDKARLEGSRIKFERSLFAKGGVTFDATIFSSGSVQFDDAKFIKGWVKRDGLDFRGWNSEDGA